MISKYPKQNCHCSRTEWKKSTIELFLNFSLIYCHRNFFAQSLDSRVNTLMFHLYVSMVLKNHPAPSKCLQKHIHWLIALKNTFLFAQCRCVSPLNIYVELCWIIWICLSDIRTLTHNTFMHACLHTQTYTCICTYLIGKGNFYCTNMCDREV